MAARLSEVTDEFEFQQSLRAFTRAAIAQALNDRTEEARDYMIGRWPETVRRSAIGGGTSEGGGAALIAWNPASAAFVHAVVHRSVIGQLVGSVAIPMAIKIPHGLGHASVKWAGEGKPSPVSALAFESVTLPDTKVAAIIPLSKTLLGANQPEVEDIVRECLVRGAVEALDAALLDPNNGGVPNVKPAALTFGAPTFTSMGSTAAVVMSDLQNLIQAVGASGLSAPLFITTPVAGAWLGGLQLPSGGGLAFPQAGALGGSLLGIPLTTSAAVPTEPFGSPQVPTTSIILVDAARVGLHLRDAIVTRSERASVEMESAPMQDATTGSGTEQVSLWQCGMIGLQLVQRAGWLRFDDNASAVLHDLVLDGLVMDA